MKRWIALGLLLAGCQSTLERAPKVWYEEAAVVCNLPACPSCRGRGDVRCNPCEGRGWSACTKCQDGTERCGTCDGDGRKNAKKCASCDGDGRRACSRCGGDKKVDCDTCGGPGRLHCLRAVRISETAPTDDDAWPEGNQPPKP